MKAYTLLAFLIFSTCVWGQKEALNKSINQIIEGKEATVGVAIIYDSKDTLVINNDHKYPMMSVFKFPQALALLHYADTYNIDLNTKVSFNLADLKEGTYSPLREDYLKEKEKHAHQGNEHATPPLNLSLGELINYSVSKSDNNASNWLFNKILGTESTSLYLQSLGLVDFQIAATEHEMEAAFDKQYLNWITPLEAVKLLNIYTTSNILSDKYRKTLDKSMIETTTGLDKIKALLPPHTVVAHKTGMSSRNGAGVKAADNDIGVIYLHNGKSVALAVLITNSKEDNKTNARIIAQISKLVYDYYSAVQP